MSLADFRRSVPSYRPAPQQPARVLRHDLIDMLHGPRAIVTLRRGRYLGTTKLGMLERIEDVRNPSDRALRISLITRARIAAGGKP